MIECSCGKGFYKWELAFAHLNESADAKGHVITFDDEAKLEDAIAIEQAKKVYDIVAELSSMMPLIELERRLVLLKAIWRAEQKRKESYPGPVEVAAPPAPDPAGYVTTQPGLSSNAVDFK